MGRKENDALFAALSLHASKPPLLPLPRPRLLFAWLCCDMLFFHLYILLPKVLHPRETPAPSEGGCLNYK